MIDVRRGAERFTTTAEDRTTRHSFSFGAHYDPANLGFASLVAHNDDLVAPGGGYGPHPHSDLEIVTWVLDGALRHEDSAGTAGVVVPGQVQRLSAGSGVRHREHASTDVDGPTRFVQMWLRPDTAGLPPSYASGEVPSGPLVAVASGDPAVDAAVRVVAAGAVLWVVRPGSATVLLPDAPAAHLFVARGSVTLEGAGPLGPGDAVRLVGDAVPRSVPATRSGWSVTAVER